MPVDTMTFDLPSAMRTEDCEALDVFLRKNAARPVRLNGAEVRKFSGQAAQVIAAHQKFRHGTPLLVIDTPSPALEEALTLLDLAAVLEERA